jgi:O-antigen/teichoic acid export membrane protein
MQRRARVGALLKSPTIISVALSGSAAAVAGLTSLLAARWMGAEERGLYALLIAGSGFLLLLSSVGVVNTANVLIADPRQNLSVRRYATLANRLLVLAAVVLLPASALIVLVYARSPGTLLFVLFACYCLLALLAAFYRAGLHGWSRHRLAFGAEVASGVIVLVGAFVVHRTGRLTVIELVALGSIAFLFQAAIARVAFRRAEPLSESAGHPMTLSQLLTLSLPSVGFTVGGWIASRGDRLVLGLVSDNVQVGIYSTAATMAEVPWLVAATLATVLGTKLAATQQAALVSRFRVRAVAGTAAVYLAIAPVGYWVLTSFLGDEFSGGVTALLLMGPAALLLASSRSTSRRAWHWVTGRLRLGCRWSVRSSWCAAPRRSATSGAPPVARSLAS